jgi:hypothetical protein
VPTNVLSVFDPIFYAQLALIQLEKALGMAGRVHRGYDKNPQQKGSVISIPVPSTFAAQDAPGTDQAINADSVNITLSNWREVKFALSDKELNYTQEEIITKHIRPAAYALADDIDQKLCALYKDVPWYNGTAGTTPSGVSDITGIRRVLFNNAVPLQDPGAMSLMIDGNAEDKFLQLAAFAQQQGAGDKGVNTQTRGSLGVKYGFDIFANQNVKTHTKGTCSTTTLAVNNASGYPAGTSTLNIDAGAVTGTLVPGDVLQFAGDTQNYAVTGTFTASGNQFNGVTITPKLKIAVVDNTVITAVLQNGVRNMAFHRNAFALAMAPLTDMANQLGAKVATVSDPITGLTLRSRVWYVGDSSAVKVGLDVLYGVKTLDPNLAGLMLG